jgi:hypothetical protein
MQPSEFFGGGLTGWKFPAGGTGGGGYGLVAGRTDGGLDADLSTGSSCAKYYFSQKRI